MANSLPFLSGFSQSVTFGEDTVNLAPQLIDADVTFFDADNNFNGGTLLLSGGLSEDILAIRHQGAGAGQIGVSGSNISYGGTVIGTFAGGSGGTAFSVTFNANANSASIEALIENLTYQTLSDTPTGSRTLELTVTDAAGAQAIPPVVMQAVTGPANPFNGIDADSLSAPRFADLDGDGDLDALVGENYGILRYYENTGTAVAPAYLEQFGAANPFNGVDVGNNAAPAFADLDGDGDLDVVIGENTGNFNYYKNTGTAIAPAYLEQTGAANPFNGIDTYNSAPSLADLDGDGDFDAVMGDHYGALGSYENSGSAAAPAYVERTGGANPFNGFDVGYFSNPAFADVDGDGDLDALVGNLLGTFLYLENNGTAAAPLFVNRPGANPFNGVDIGLHAKLDFGDVDGDGDLDAALGEGDGTIRYYENTAAATASPAYVAQTGVANPFNGFDVGLVAKPSLVDLDGDGDLDAVAGEFYGTLQYFKNTGTAIAPHYVAQTGAANPFAAIDVGSGAFPGLADLDGDGDLDAVVGEEYGTFRYFRNTGTAIAPAYAEQTGAANPFNGVDFSYRVAPSFADLDGDGDFDAVMGAEDGTLRYYENTGSAVAPVFVARTGAANPFDGIDLGFHSAPAFVDLDDDGDLDAVIGEELGTLKYFENTGTAIAPAYAEQTGAANPFAGIDLSFRAAPSFGDLDGDGDSDLAIGDFDGTIKYYLNTGAGFELVLDITQHADPSGGADVMNGTGGNDTLSGLGGNDTLFGLGGNDTLDGGAGDDRLDGGADTDTASYASAGSSVSVSLALQGTGQNTGAAGNDTLAGFENLSGSGFDDALTGNAGANLLDGGAGNDTLDGGAGGDTLIGGAGDDTYLVDSATDVLVETAGQGTDRVLASASTTLSAEVEDLTLVELAAAYAARTGAANPFNGFATLSESTPNFADVDGDGDLDAVSGDGTSGLFLRYYENTGSGVAPAYVERAGGANPFDGINVGFRASSALGDVDGDGDFDAVVGENLGSLQYLENTGTGIAPAYVERFGAANPFNGIDVGYTSKPALADVDGDGDLDALVGEQYGTFLYFENTGAGAAPAYVQRTGAANPFNGFDSDFASAPSFGDVDGDGDLDVVSGEAFGTLVYLENTGTAVAPAYALRTGAANPFNGIDVTPGVPGASSPDLLDMDGDGDLDALVGEAFGTFKYYENTVVKLDGTGNGLANTITGNNLSNVLAGLGGGDTLDGAGAADQLDGGAGIDTASYASAISGVTVSLALQGAGQSTGGSGNDTLTGFENLTGSGFDDALTGDAVANTLDGGAGNDTLAGGAGDDIYILNAAGDVVQENAAEGIDLVRSPFSYTLGAEVENLTLLGSGNINGTGNGLANTISGNSGDNTLDGGAGNDLLDGGEGNDTVFYGSAGALVIVSLDAQGAGQNTGASGNDTLYGFENLTGSGFNDLLFGNSGDNVLDGGAGGDFLAGVAGNDTYLVDAVGDVVVEIAAGGTDLVQSAVSFTLGADVENLTLTGSGNLDGTGNELANTITGNSGNNTLDGGAGNDSLAGGAGTDTVSYVSAGADVVVSLGAQGAGQNTGGSGNDTLSGFENLFGSSFNDTLTGDGNANAIDGGEGNDTIFDFGVGSDTLLGGVGNDTLDGGLGSDSLAGGADIDTVSYASAGAVTVSLALQGVGQNTGGSGNDTLSGFENLFGSSFNDTLTGDANANGVDGGEGNDIVDGGAGNDVLAGGTDFDTVLYASAGAGVTVSLAAQGVGQNTGGSGNDTLSGFENLTGSSFNDTLTGDANANGLEGGGGADALDGGAGADTLNGGGGADSLVGGADIDTASYAGTGAGVTVSLATQGTGQNTGGAGNDTLTGFENLLGSSFNDTLTGDAGSNRLTGGAGADSLIGGFGFDTLDGGTGNDSMAGGPGNDTYIVDAGLDVVTENAAEGTDTVQTSATYTLAANVENLVLTGTLGINGTGNSLNNTLTGNGGINNLNGGTGNDTMLGGLGNDTYVVDSALDVVAENASAGTDLVQASISYTLLGNVESLTLIGSGLSGTGNAVANTIIGTTGNDTLNGAAGIDTLIGGAGNDTYVVDNGSDVVAENAAAGTDLVLASASYTLVGNIENLTLTGTLGIAGTGNAQDNVVTGNSGANSLSGGIGNDTLDGGTGNDSMFGGTGNDTYIVDAAGDLVAENLAEGFDTVQTSSSYLLLGNVENLTLTGSANINGTGNALSNVVTGNAGDNVLDGGVGVDTLVGGAGNDTYVVNAPGDVVTEGVSAGTDLVQSTATSYVLGANVENLTLLGTFNLNGTGNTLSNVITGNGGNNTLNGSTGNDTLTGGAGDDTLLYDAADGLVDGGAQALIDVLKIAGSGIVLNLTGLSGTTLQNFEAVDLTGTGNNTLTLTASQLLALSSTSDLLLVDGNAGDVVNAGSGWVTGGDQVIGLNTYHSYTQGLASLLVDTDITQNVLP